MMAIKTAYTVAICSRNGHVKLERLFDSLHAQDLSPQQVLLLDDGSQPTLAPTRQSIGSVTIEIFRNEIGAGLISCRNRLMRLAAHEYVLILDDDVVLADPTVIRRTVEKMASDEEVGAVALRQTDRNGVGFSPQPLNRAGCHQIGTYYGWAHLLRRSAWLKAGPFMEFFKYGGEEVDFSLRLLDNGFKVVADSSLAVVHDVADGSKNLPRRHFLNLRNTLLTYVLRYPAGMVPLWVVNTVRVMKPLDSERGSHTLYRLRLIFALFAQTRHLLIWRRPVSADTVKKFWRLHNAAQQS